MEQLNVKNYGNMETGGRNPYPTFYMARPEGTAFQNSTYDWYPIPNSESNTERLNQQDQTGEMRFGGSKENNGAGYGTAKYQILSPTKTSRVQVRYTSDRNNNGFKDDSAGFTDLPPNPVKTKLLDYTFPYYFTSKPFKEQISWLRPYLYPPAPSAPCDLSNLNEDRDTCKLEMRSKQQGLKDKCETKCKKADRKRRTVVAEEAEEMKCDRCKEKCSGKRCKEKCCNKRSCQKSLNFCCKIILSSIVVSGLLFLASAALSNYIAKQSEQFTSSFDVTVRYTNESYDKSLSDTNFLPYRVLEIKFCFLMKGVFGDEMKSCKVHYFSSGSLVVHSNIAITQRYLAIMMLKIGVMSSYDVIERMLTNQIARGLSNRTDVVLDGVTLNDPTRPVLGAVIVQAEISTDRAAPSKMCNEGGSEACQQIVCKELKELFGKWFDELFGKCSLLTSNRTESGALGLYLSIELMYDKLTAAALSNNKAASDDNIVEMLNRDISQFTHGFIFNRNARVVSMTKQQFSPVARTTTLPTTTELFTMNLSPTTFLPITNTETPTTSSSVQTTTSRTSTNPSTTKTTTPRLETFTSSVTVKNNGESETNDTFDIQALKGSRNNDRSRNKNKKDEDDDGDVAFVVDICDDTDGKCKDKTGSGRRNPTDKKPSREHSPGRKDTIGKINEDQSDISDDDSKFIIFDNDDNEKNKNDNHDDSFISFDDDDDKQSRNDNHVEDSIIILETDDNRKNKNDNRGGSLISLIVDDKKESGNENKKDKPLIGQSIGLGGRNKNKNKNDNDKNKNEPSILFDEEEPTFNNKENSQIVSSEDDFESKDFDEPDDSDKGASDSESYINLNVAANNIENAQHNAHEGLGWANIKKDDHSNELKDNSLEISSTDNAKGSAVKDSLAFGSQLNNELNHHHNKDETLDDKAHDYDDYNEEYDDEFNEEELYEKGDEGWRDNLEWLEEDGDKKLFGSSTVEKIDQINNDTHISLPGKKESNSSKNNGKSKEEDGSYNHYDKYDDDDDDFDAKEDNALNEDENQEEFSWTSWLFGKKEKTEDEVHETDEKLNENENENKKDTNSWLPWGSSSSITKVDEDINNKNKSENISKMPYDQVANSTSGTDTDNDNKNDKSDKQSSWLSGWFGSGRSSEVAEEQKMADKSEIVEKQDEENKRIAPSSLSFEANNFSQIIDNSSADTNATLDLETKISAKNEGLSVASTLKTPTEENSKSTSEARKIVGDYNDREYDDDDYDDYDDEKESYRYDNDPNLNSTSEAEGENHFDKNWKEENDKYYNNGNDYDDYGYGNDNDKNFDWF